MKSGFWEKNFSLLFIYIVLMIVSFSFLRSEFRNMGQNDNTAESGPVQTTDLKNHPASNFVDSFDPCDPLEENAKMDQFLRDWEKIVLEETLEDIRNNANPKISPSEDRPILSSAPNLHFQIALPAAKESTENISSVPAPVAKESALEKTVKNEEKKSEADEIQDRLPFLHAYPKMESASSDTLSPRYRTRFGIRLKPLSALKYNESENQDPVDFFDVRYEADSRPAEDPQTSPVFANVSMERPLERSIEEPAVSSKDPGKNSDQPAPAANGLPDPVKVSFEKDALSPIPAEIPIADKYSLKEEGKLENLPAPQSADANISAVLENEIWMISSERAASCNSGSECLDFWKLSSGCWNTQTEETFLSGNGRFPATIVFIHGYLTDMQMAVQEGNLLRHRITSLQKKYRIDAPFRLVIWKWDSTKTFTRIRRDALSKAVLANCDGQCLASLFSKMDKPERITLVGFSFGGRMAGSALQYLEPKGPDPQIEYRMILLLAAADYADFSSVGRYARGLQNLSALLNVYNPRDRVLRFYPKMYGHSGPQATGTAPLPCTVPIPEGNLSINMSGYGPEHKFSHGLYAVPDSSLIDFIFGIRNDK
ncbi:MAG: hypothetical protein Q4G69_07065 [Planctomycetia bacterium]|nr:hypothetical protein [Planctomycetia bacterium]